MGSDPLALFLRGRSVLSAGAWLGTLALWANFLWAPWPFPASPLFIRTGGPEFFGNHLISVVAIMSVVTWRMSREAGTAYRALLVTMTLVTVHEWMLPLAQAAVLLPSVALPRIVVAITVYNPAKYIVALGLVFVSGFQLATQGERHRIAQTILVMLAFTLAWQATLWYGPFGNLTMDGYSPGPAFWSPVPNLFEIGSSVLASLMWVPKIEN